MRFYESLGIDESRKYPATDLQERFFALTRLERSNMPGGTSDEISRQVGSTLSPEDPSMKEVLIYCVGELIANVLQHSRGVGAIASQYYPKMDVVELAVADTGIGILNALHENPLLKSSIATNEEAIREAKKPRVSGKAFPSGSYHDRKNMGVGLYILSRITAYTHGYMYMWSGDAFSLQDGTNADKLRTGCHMTGTYVCVRIKRSMVYSMGEMLRDALNDMEKKELDGDIQFD